MKQESHYELLLAGDVITEEEREVLAWGCNAKVHVPPRFKNSGKHKLTYKHATAMEVLVRSSPVVTEICSAPVLFSSYSSKVNRHLKA